MLDYMTLKLIWFGLMMALLWGFLITAAADLGIGILLKSTCDEKERRILLNTLGLHWEGNQVWFILFGGALFAAWPLVYAAAFSGLYGIFFLILVAFILRPPGLDFRSKLPDPLWRSLWDHVLFVSSALPSFLIGAGIAHMFLGFPFSYDAHMRVFYHAAWYQHITPLTFVGGLGAVAFFLSQGALYCLLRTQAALAKKIRKVASWSLIVSLCCSLYILIASSTLKHPEIVAHPDLQKAFLPYLKEVHLSSQSFFAYAHQSVLFFPTLVSYLLCMACSFLANRKGLSLLAWCTHSLAMILLSMVFAWMLFPFIMISSSNLSHSLTIWDAVSSATTLKVMLAVVVIFLPIVLLYTLWAYKVLWGHILADDLKKPEAY